MKSVTDTVAEAEAVEKKTRCAIYWKQRIWSLDRAEQLMGEQWRAIMDKQRVEAGYATVPWDIFDQLSVDEQQIAVTALLIGKDKKWKRREGREWPVCVIIEEDEEGIARLLEVKEGEEIGVSEEEEEVEEKKEWKEDEEDEEPPGKRARMQSALTTNTGNSVASRLKQCSLKKKLEDDSHLLSAFSPDFRRESDDAPRKKLTDGDRALIRVIAQYFQDLGLSETVQTLSKESRCKVENSHAVRLRSAIHETNWDDAVAIIDSCYDHLTPEHIETVRNILIEEKFFDLIRKQKRPLALLMLKRDFDPGNPMREPLMKLLFETDEDIFRQKAYEKYRPVKGGHRNTERICTRIQKVLPASFMLPTNRLQTLLDQAFETQVARCETHIHRERECESRGEPSMLFEDHKCQKREEKYFIETCMREDHKSEVWKVSFSPCGKFLATASFATVVYFWKVNPRTRQLEHYRKITARDTTHGISGMSWSADSKLLAVCGVDDHPYGMYIYDMHGDSLFTQIPHHEAHSFTCIDFFRRQFKDGHYHLTVGDLRGSITFMEISRDYSNKINSYEGYRIRCVYSCKSGRGAYAADTHNRVRWYRNTWNNSTPTDHTVIREENTITNMSMHPSEQLMLLTTKILGLRMWNVQARTLLRTFQGYHDGGYVLNACFGGMNNEYIVTGSYTTDEYDDEGNVIRRQNDNDCAMEETIRIWRLTDEYQVCGIAGHRSTVNSVSWNPRDPFMIASGSDDHSIRLWSCRQEDLPQSFTEERHHLFSKSLRDVDTFKKEGETSAASAPLAIPKKEGENDETPIEDEEEDSDDSDGSTDSDDSDESGDDEDSSDDPSDYDYEDVTDHEDIDSISRDLVERDRGEYRRIPIYDLFRAADAGEAAEGDDEREEDEDIDEEEDVYYEDDGEERGEEVEGEEREGEHDVEDEDEDEDDDDSSSPANQSPN